MAHPAATCSLRSQAGPKWNSGWRITTGRCPAGSSLPIGLCQASRTFLPSCRIGISASRPRIRRSNSSRRRARRKSTRLAPKERAGRLVARPLREARGNEVRYNSLSGLLVAAGTVTSADAFRAATGPRGGAAVAGPRGAAVRGPGGSAAAVGRYGGTAVRGPNGNVAVRGGYGGGGFWGGGGGGGARARGVRGGGGGGAGPPPRPPFS